MDLNHGPHPYQGCALTGLSYGPRESQSVQGFLKVREVENVNSGLVLQDNPPTDALSQDPRRQHRSWVSSDPAQFRIALHSASFDGLAPALAAPSSLGSLFPWIWTIPLANRWFRDMTDQAWELAGIFDDLLTVGRAELGELGVAFVSVNIGANVAQVIESMGAQGHHVTVDGDPNVTRRGDPANYRQVLAQPDEQCPYAWVRAHKGRRHFQ